MDAIRRLFGFKRRNAVAPTIINTATSAVLTKAEDIKSAKDLEKADQRKKLNLALDNFLSIKTIVRVNKY